MKDEATPEQLAMAREIAARVNEAKRCPFVAQAMRNGEHDNSDAVEAALAAIIETTELAARHVHNLSNGKLEMHIARDSLRNMDHLKGRP